MALSTPSHPLDAILFALSPTNSNLIRHVIRLCDSHDALAIQLYAFNPREIILQPIGALWLIVVLGMLS